jgi:hypothetical protein
MSSVIFGSLTEYITEVKYRNLWVEEHVERKDEQEVSREKCYSNVNWRDLPLGFVKTLTTLRVSKPKIILLGILGIRF